MFTLNIKDKIFSLFKFIMKKLPLTRVKIFEKRLDLLESLPVLQNEEIYPYEKLLESVKVYHEAIDSKEDYLKLKRKIIALEYRIGKKLGGCDLTPVDSNLFEKLKSALMIWKNNSENLTSRDLLALKTTSQYANFAKAALADKNLFNDYANWVFRDGNHPDAFIQYPNTVKKLIESNLGGRIGRINENDLKIEYRWNEIAADEEKVLTLPMNGKSTCILDDTLLVTFKGNYKLTIKEIFNIFKNKELNIGNLEYLLGGIFNWNTHLWGYFDADKNKIESIDLSHIYWWEQLPYFEILDKKESKKRFGIELNGTCWYAFSSATRLRPKLDYENTHAYLEMAIPRGDGTYAVYSFGKVATKFPANFLETLEIFCHNLHATLAYPDDNVYYSHRSYACHPFILTEAQGLQLMAVLKRDMIKGQSKNFVYQIESDNCAKWVHDSLAVVLGEERVPDIFRMRLLDTEPLGMVSHIFKWIKKLPKNWQTPVLTFFHWPMGAWQETWIIENGRKVCKSIRLHDFWKTGIVFLPARLHMFKEEGLLPEASGAIELMFKATARGEYPYLKRFGVKVPRQMDYVQNPNQFEYKRRGALTKSTLHINYS